MPSLGCLQVGTQHIDALVPGGSRGLQLVQSSRGMEEEAAIHPEPIDDPGSRDSGHSCTTGSGMLRLGTLMPIPTRPCIHLPTHTPLHSLKRMNLEIR